MSDALRDRSREVPAAMMPQAMVMTDIGIPEDVPGMAWSTASFDGVIPPSVSHIVLAFLMKRAR
jgi:hypothetical protein